MANPRHPAEARSSTAHTSDRQECSPGSRPITLTRRRVSPKVRSMKLEWRLTRQPMVRFAAQQRNTRTDQAQLPHLNLPIGYAASSSERPHTAKSA